MLTELIQAATIIDSVVSERMKVYEASFKFEVKNAPEYGYFLDIINSVSQRDKIKIVLQDETEQVYDFSLGNEEDYKGFINDTLEDEIINVKVKIDKEVVNNHFSIYAFDEFVKDILSLSLEEVMIAFSNLLKQSSNYLVFDVYSPVAMFATNGAVYMCDEEVMSLIAEKLGSDLIVIPSSIHETIILKETENMSVRELNAMVEAVNAEAVDPQERLGNFVYRFDREAQRLEKAVEQAEELDFEPGMSPVFA